MHPNQFSSPLSRWNGCAAVCAAIQWHWPCALCPSLCLCLCQDGMDGLLLSSHGGIGHAHYVQVVAVVFIEMEWMDCHHHCHLMVALVIHVMLSPSWLGHAFLSCMSCSPHCGCLHCSGVDAVMHQICLVPWT